MNEKPGTGLQPSREGRRRRLAMVLAMIAFVAVLTFFVRNFSRLWKENQTSLPSVEECLQLESLKNIALAFLENEEYAEADKRLTQIEAKLPAEPLGRRDLAAAAGAG